MGDSRLNLPFTSMVAKLEDQKEEETYLVMHSTSSYVVNLENEKWVGFPKQRAWLGWVGGYNQGTHSLMGESLMGLQHLYNKWFYLQIG